jgi:hypothetical protein
LLEEKEDLWVVAELRGFDKVWALFDVEGLSLFGEFFG